MTYTDKDIIRELLENDGVYPGDPQMYSIYSYKRSLINRKDEELFAVFARNYHFDLNASPYVISYKLLWQAGIGLTAEGIQWLRKNKK